MDGEDEGALAWRYPMADMEIQYGASLTVRESQMAVFVNEGKIADVFGPGTYKLTTQTMPVLTNLKNWDKLFESPFKTDVYFFSTRVQVDQRWGTPQPITIRDKDFGTVRLRAFGNYGYRVADPKLFHSRDPGTREVYTVAELDGQLRGMILRASPTPSPSGIPFLDMAANQIEFAARCRGTGRLQGHRPGARTHDVQNVSLPEELQKMLDQRIGMGMVGNDMGKFMQYQTAQAIPEMAKAAASGGGGVAGDAMGLGAGIAWARCWRRTCERACRRPAHSGRRPPRAAVRPEDVMATLEKLGELKAKGILTQEEFDAKKAELLKKLV